MTRDDFRQRANVVREIPLATVLHWRGAVRDPRDRSKWDTEQGPVSVTSAKFTNWQQNHGGGGAIDLVMHLGRLDFRAAVEWLERRGGTVAPLAAHEGTGRCCQARSVVIEARSGSLRLPVPDASQLDRVIDYLTRRRHLAAALLEPLLQSGKLYPDRRGNAVFLLVAGKGQRPVGAELRGTGPRIWRGMAPGTRKEDGYFWTGVPGSWEIVLCESAIDAISCSQLDPQRICISTSGVRTNPRWLPGLIARGYHIHCGFDTDDAGELAATRMIAQHPTVQRLRPPAHDWNDALSVNL
jgi:hypothetical protein